jgi:hypothetical protein
MQIMTVVFRILGGGVRCEECLEETDYRSNDGGGWSATAGKEVQSETRFASVGRLQETGAGKLLGGFSLQPDCSRKIND